MQPSGLLRPAFAPFKATPGPQEVYGAEDGPHGNHWRPPPRPCIPLAASCMPHRSHLCCPAHPAPPLQLPALPQIGHAGDGGLYAEMVQDRSFDALAAATGFLASPPPACRSTCPPWRPATATRCARCTRPGTIPPTRRTAASGSIWRSGGATLPTSRGERFRGDGRAALSLAAPQAAGQPHDHTAHQQTLTCRHEQTCVPALPAPAPAATTSLWRGSPSPAPPRS